MTKGYKVFNSDWTCRGFQYEVGKTYEEDVVPDVCKVGFHFCPKLADCFGYYDFNPNNKVAEIEAIGDIDEGDNKCCTNKITIVKEIAWQEMLELVNTGKGDTGLCNTGNWNTGNRNTGYWNTGNRNTGDWNTGNWNKCNNETGFFNSKDNKYCNVFNKKCLRSKFIEAKKPDFIYDVNPNVWVDWDNMNDDEKKTHPNSDTQGGYLKSISMEEAWKIAFEKATDEDIELLKKLPNYDYEVFSEITGLTDERLK